MNSNSTDLDRAPSAAPRTMRRALWVGLGLWVAFNLLIASGLVSRYRVASPNQWQANEVRAQDYVYRRRAPSLVITGSSLAQRIVSADPRAYNLAFASASAVTGIEIITRSAKFPKFALVELNTLDIERDPKMLDALFHPFWKPFRKLFRSQQAKNRPANYFLFPLAWGLLTIQSASQPTASEPARSDAGDLSEAGNVAPEDRRKRPAEGTPADGGEQPAHQPSPPGREASPAGEGAVDTGRVEQGLRAILAAEAPLRSRGTELIFFVMPVPRGVAESPEHRGRLAAMQRLLGPKRTLLPAPMEQTYHFPDGVHLDGPSALAYSRWLFARLTPLVKDR